MSKPEQPAPMPMKLLAHTLTHWIDPAAHVIKVSSTDLQPGLSGAPVQRYHIHYTTGGQDAEVSLVTKEVTRRE